MAIIPELSPMQRLIMAIIGFGKPEYNSKEIDKRRAIADLGTGKIKRSQLAYLEQRGTRYQKELAKEVLNEVQ